jgi:hypothetical protein
MIYGIFFHFVPESALFINIFIRYFMIVSNYLIYTESINFIRTEYSI